MSHPTEATAKVNSRLLAEAGELGSATHLVRVTQACLTDGPGAGMRVIDVVAAGGFSVRILPDRGLDIGDAWYGGMPVAWRSNVGEARPGSVDSGKGWLDGWGGGLLTTCGPRNAGEPSDGHGQHGSFTDLAAQDLSVSRTATEDGRQVVRVAATLIDASSLGACIRIRRVISIFESGGIEVEDVTSNDGPDTEQVPFLYHVNVGSPFLSEDSRLSIGGTEEPVRMGSPSRGDVIREHDVDSGGVERTAIFSSPRLGIDLRVEWSSAELDRVHSWQRNVPGAYVLAVEPANCGLHGREADRADGRAPYLEPGEERCTGIRFRVARHSRD